LLAGRELGGVRCFMGSMCGTALGDDEVVGVVEVVAAGVDSLEGILGSLWVATVGVLCTGR